MEQHTPARDVVAKLRRIRRELIEAAKLIEDNPNTLYLLAGHEEQLREYSEEVDIILKSVL